MVGAGGIGVDVSEFLTHDAPATLDVDGGWRTGASATRPLHPGGLDRAEAASPAREVHLLQRKTTPIGKGLGKTSGWAHRAVLKATGVDQVTRRRTYDRGRRRRACTSPSLDGARRTPGCSTVRHTSCMCAGQESVRDLYDDLRGARRRRAHLIGGADVAAELDAKRAIEQGTELAARL